MSGKSRPEQINDLWPTWEEVPESAKYQPIDASHYLNNGELIKWEGPNQTVNSAICIRDGEKIERKVIGEIHLLDKDHAMELLDSAVNAFDSGRGYWPTTTVEERVNATSKFLSMYKAQRENMVRLLMWEIGKSRKDSENEFDRTADYIKATIDAVKSRSNLDAQFHCAEGHVAQIRRSPIGIVLSMGPFNYPLNETFTTLIPAIIMGNCVVVKLPRFGCLCITPLLIAFKECFPKGVVNIFNGRGRDTVGPMISSGKVTSLAFIGSSDAVNKLRIQHPKPSRLRCILGLDAKNAAIVMKDCDLDITINEVITGTLSFSGQRCTAIKIVFVQKEIAKQFVEKLSKKVDTMTIGLPWENPQIAPLAEENKTEFLETLVQDAIKNGAKVTNQYGGLHNKTFFFPSVVYPINSNCKLYTIEQFGPIIPVCEFTLVEDVISYLAESNYGQQVSLFSTTPRIVGPLCDVLVNQVCRVNLNGACKRGPDVFPFTARKDSAEGTLDIESALRAFSIRSMVAAPITDLNRKIIQGVITERSSRFLNNDLLW